MCFLWYAEIGNQPFGGFQPLLWIPVSTQMTFSAGRGISVSSCLICFFYWIRKNDPEILTLLEVIQSQNPWILGLTGFFFHSINHIENLKEQKQHKCNPNIWSSSREQLLLIGAWAIFGGGIVSARLFPSKSHLYMPSHRALLSHGAGSQGL